MFQPGSPECQLHISFFFFIFIFHWDIAYYAVLVSGTHKAIQLHMDMYLFFFRFFSHICYYKVLSRILLNFLFLKLFSFTVHYSLT